MSGGLLDAHLVAAAAAAPERTAVVATDGGRLAYGELLARSGALAAWLAARGIGRGDRVGVMLPKGLDAVCAIVGALRAGAAYVPVDAGSPVGRARAILGDCAVSAAFVDAERAADVRGVAGELVEVPGEGWERALASPGAPPAGEGRCEDDLAYVLYTSGSTGTPKGVMLTHANALAFVDWALTAFAPGPEDRFTSHAPLHFDLSIFDLFVALLAGAELHLVDAALSRNPRALAAFVGERRPTVWYSTPTTLAMLAEHGRLERVDAGDLRAVLFAGEVFPVQRLRRLTEIWPHPSYYNLYGPTETNVCTCAPVPLPIPADRTAPYPIGRACSDDDLLVLDGPGGVEVPAGEPGLLHVAGPSVFAGYWNRPDETAARTFERDGRRWYDTGDVVREDPREGLVYVGRRDRMVKRHGYRIELDEVEAALYRHPAVREAGVVALPDEDAGCTIHAHLVIEGERPSILELKTFSASVLPDSMVPDRFHLRDEPLPRTSTDKVDHKSLGGARAP